MSDTLEERLKTHSSAFDGLLSLIPAKYYYDDATQDQWQQKKKAKKDIQNSKREKLNPESSAQADDYNTGGASAKDVMENKAQAAKLVKLPSAKKTEEIIHPEKSEIIQKASIDNDSEQDTKNQGDINFFDDEGNAISSSNDDDDSKSSLKEEMMYKKSQKKEKSEEDQRIKEERLKDLKKKLASKITDLREKRKAPGTKAPGAPKSREQILEERRKKEEIKRQEKLKRKHEEIENALTESESEVEDGNEDNKESNDVLFGNIVFDDGTRVTSDLSGLRSTPDKRKQKGPANNDLKAHLFKLEQKKKKLEQLDPEERKMQLEKEKWQKVITQADGVKVKDDERLLKKAIKRKEKQKLKSEIAWKERKQTVKDTVAARAKRREENLKARKDNKGKKGKKQPRLRKFTGISKSSNKKRAGFEGSAKSKGKSKK